MNTTRDGIEVKVGQVWADRDKRMPGRECVVVGVGRGFAFMQGLRGGRVARIAIGRMHNKSTGWRLVSQPKEE